MKKKDFVPFLFNGFYSALSWGFYNFVFWAINTIFISSIEFEEYSFEKTVKKLVFLFFFLVLLTLSFIGFYFLGKKMLYNTENGIWNVLSVCWFHIIFMITFAYFFKLRDLITPFISWFYILLDQMYFPIDLTCFFLGFLFSFIPFAFIAIGLAHKRCCNI